MCLWVFEMWRQGLEQMVAVCDSGFFKHYVTAGYVTSVVLIDFAGYVTFVVLIDFAGYVTSVLLIDFVGYVISVVLIDFAGYVISTSHHTISLHCTLPAQESESQCTPSAHE